MYDNEQAFFNGLNRFAGKVEAVRTKMRQALKSIERVNQSLDGHQAVFKTEDRLEISYLGLEFEVSSGFVIDGNAIAVGQLHLALLLTDENGKKSHRHIGAIFVDKYGNLCKTPDSRSVTQYEVEAADIWYVQMLNECLRSVVQIAREWRERNQITITPDA